MDSTKSFIELLDLLIDPIFILDGTTYLHVNKSAAELLGYETSEDLIGIPAFRHVAPEFREYSQNLAKARQNGEPVPEKYMMQLIDKKGNTIDVEAHVSTIIFQGKPASLAINHDITELIRAEKALERRLNIERIFAEISSTLANSPTTKIDEGINSALKNIAQFTGANRSSLFIFSDDLELTTNTHEWCETANDSQIDLLQGIPFETFGYYKKRLLNLDPIIISSIEDIPPEAIGEKEWVLEHGFRSSLFVPIIHNGRLHGAIGVYGKVGDEIEWPEDYLGLLRLLGITLSTSLERKLSAEALRESEDLFRGFMQSANEVFILYDKEMRFVEVNDSWLQRSGLKREDVIGKNIIEVSPMLKETGRYEAYLKVLETGEPIEFHAIESATAPGKIIEIKAFKTGNFLGLISRDMSEQKRFQERLEALHFYGSKLSKADSYEMAAKFTLEAVERVFGYQYNDFNLVQDDNLVPINVEDETLRNNLVLHVDGPGIIVRAYKTGESQLVHDTRLDEDYVYGRDEDTEWLSELAVPVKIENEVVAVINMEQQELGAFTESDQKLIETLAIHVASAFVSLRARETHDEIYRQMIDQKLRVEQAQVLEQIKNNFIMKATHELRTPLTIIKGYSELLLEKEVNSDPETLVDFLSVILKNVKRSEILINDLLDESQLRSGNYVLNLELNDFSRLVDDVKNDAEIFFVPKNQQLSVKIPSGIQPFVFDKDRLYQVFMNLILNASKFSGYDSKVKLVVEDNGMEVKVSITDEGVGIRKEDIDRIFQPFPGIEEGTIQPGVGIGLSICKGFVELHGGEIWAESEGLQKGSTFTFTLPVSDTPAKKD